MKEYLDRIEHEVADLIRQPYPPDDEVPDICGRLARISRDINELKRGLLAEAPGPTRGKSYAITAARKASRSYNTARLIHAFDAQGVGIQQLRSEDVVRLSWQWTKLKAAAYRHGVTLSIAPHEITDDGDLDAPMIGETWTDDMRVEGL